MSLRSLQLRPISTSHYYISGDVTIEPGAAIAPGVLLQADPDSRILIRAGACIGIGAILHAHNGTVEIGTGANIGAEALLVGQVQVGTNACIGAATTIFNSNIERGQMIPPGSVIENVERSEQLKTTDTVIYPLELADSAADQPTNGTTSSTHNGLPNNGLPNNGLPNNGLPNSTPNSTPNGASNSNGLAASEPATQPSSVAVCGQVYVNRMFFKMFPHDPRSSDALAPQPPPASEDPWDD